MAKAPPSFPFFPNDYIGGTRHLPLIARACYFEMLLFQWQNGFIPKDPNQRMALCGLPEETWRTIWQHIGDKFDPIDIEGETVLVNLRMHEDREEAIESWLRNRSKSSRLSETRRAAANARWEKHRASNQNAKCNANAMQLDASGEKGKGNAEASKRSAEESPSYQLSNGSSVSLPGDLSESARPELIDAFCRYLTVRSTEHKDVQPMQIPAIWAQLQTHNEKDRLRVLDLCIANGWKSLVNDGIASGLTAETSKPRRLTASELDALVADEVNA